MTSQAGTAAKAAMPWPPNLRAGPWLWDIAAVAGVSLSYFTLFLVMRGDPLPQLLQATGRNVASLVIAVAVARPWIRRALRLKLGPQVAAHLTLAVGFALLWLWLLTLAGAVLGAGSVMRFMVNPFLIGPAAEWQMFQGLYVYGLVAALTALREGRGGDGGVIVLTAAEAAERPHLIREGDELRPLSVGRIVAVRGADDYSELVTLDGACLVQTRLAAFERMLDPERFVRVHRSAIINLEHLERAEPAGGGRLLIHMTRGETICSSREGAKVLRDRLV